MERELEKTSCGLLGEGVEGVTLFGFVDAQAAEGFPVRMVCSVVGVSPSAYYAYRHRPQSGPAQLAEGCPGGRDPGHLDRVGWDLWFATGVRRAASAWAGGEPQAGGCGLMKGHRMAGFVPRKRRVTTTADSTHRIPDLLGGDFGASVPDEAWGWRYQLHPNPARVPLFGVRLGLGVPPSGWRLCGIAYEGLARR